MEQRPEPHRPDAEKIDARTGSGCWAAADRARDRMRASAETADSAITDTLSAVDRERLVAVVARHGRSTIDRALTAELILAVLPPSLQILMNGPEAAGKLAERIADALLEDPSSVARLDRLVAAIARLPGPIRGVSP